jgi:hypothetical protein
VAGLAKSTIIFIWAIWKDCPTIQEIFLNIVLSGPTILGWPIAHFIFWLLYIVCQPFLPTRPFGARLWRGWPKVQSFLFGQSGKIAPPYKKYF